MISGRCILERDALGNESLKEYEARRIPQPCHYAKEETAYGYDTVGRRLSISNTYGTVEQPAQFLELCHQPHRWERLHHADSADRMGNLTTYYPPVQGKERERL